MPDKTEVAVVERPIAYYYTDSYLGQPFPVYEGTEAAWWTDGGTKLQQLMGRFKMHDTVVQACYITGITEKQYKYFKGLHPWFVDAIRVYRTLPAAKIKDIILTAAIGDEKRGIKPNAKIALGAYRIFEEPETDPDFAPPVKGIQLPISAGGSVATLIQEAFMDAEGNVIAKRKTAQLLQDGDDN
jgi:hypothetical protein